MTRKALRKRRKEAEKRLARTPARRSAPPWATVGALVASTAFGAAHPTTVSAAQRRDSRGVSTADTAITRRVDLPPEFAAQNAPARRFDIPPAPLGDVLAAFERATGVKVTLAIESIGTLQSAGVSGVFTVEQALGALLAGTGVTYHFTSPTMVRLELGGLSESVDVAGRAPAEVVDSPKYVVSLRQVPQTIEIIPRAAMEAQGVTTLSEALRNVPGITMQAGEGGGASSTAGDMFNMRGFNAANSLFVDNVRDDGLISRDVFNLEQVEVFMGPTGSDVGRGTAAGYVNMQTKTPHLPASSSASFSYGSADQKRLTLDVNHPLPIGEADSWLGKTAVRLNGVLQDSGVPGRDFAEFKTMALAPTIGFGIDTPTRLTVQAQVLKQDNVPDYGIPGAAWPEDPLTPTTVQAPAPVDQANYYGSPAYDYDHATQGNGTIRFEHTMNNRLTLRNQARYNRAHREAVITTIQNVAAYNPANNQVTLARQGNDRENTIFSNQTGVVGRFDTGTLQHAASLGIEYTSEAQLAPALVGVGTRAPVDIFSPNPNDPVIGYAVSPSGASTKGQTDTVALYAFETVDLGVKWQANGGLRWEYFDTEYRAVDAAGLVTTNERASDGLLSGKLGLLFKASDTGNLYVSYGSTLTPPGTANFTLSAQANNQNNPNVEPQQSTNLEAGAKWDLVERRLLLDAAVFRTVNKNVIFTVDATAIPPIYNQDDGQLVRGVTIGISGRILPQWEILTNFAYLDTEQQSQNPVNNGKRLTLTPEFSGSFWTTYHLPRGLAVGGGLRMTDSVFINSANTIQSPGYHIVDTLVEYAVNTHLTLRMNVFNLTDETYIRNVNNNGGRYNPGYPRSVMLTSGIKF